MFVFLLFVCATCSVASGEEAPTGVYAAIFNGFKVSGLNVAWTALHNSRKKMNMQLHDDHNPAVLFRSWNATDIKVVPIANNSTSIVCTNETYEFDGYEQVFLPHLQVLSALLACPNVKCVLSFSYSVHVLGCAIACVSNRQ